jgi:hypothetical protein
MVCGPNVDQAHPAHGAAARRIADLPGKVEPASQHTQCTSRFVLCQLVSWTVALRRMWVFNAVRRKLSANGDLRA